MGDDPVVICEYDERWPDDFAAIRRRVQDALGDLAVAVEHIGSTAVPGLAAKPIIDLDVVVAAQGDAPVAIDRLSAIGYRHQGELLREDADAARAYADLKRQLARRFGDDRDVYTEAKAPFIEDVLRNETAPNERIP